MTYVKYILDILSMTPFVGPFFSIGANVIRDIQQQKNNEKFNKRLKSLEVKEHDNDLININTQEIIACKCVFNIIDNIQIVKSKNVSSLTDLANNEFKINFTSPVKNYSVQFYGNKPIKNLSVIKETSFYLHFKLEYPLPEILTIILFFDSI